MHSRWGGGSHRGRFFDGWRSNAIRRDRRLPVRGDVCRIRTPCGRAEARPYGKNLPVRGGGGGVSSSDDPVWFKNRPVSNSLLEESENLLQIAVAIPDDAEAILSLQKHAYQSEALLYADPVIPPLTETLAEMRSRFSDHLFLKATSNGAIVGSVRGRVQGDTCLIGRLIVHSDVQGQGIGTRLLITLEAAFPHVARFELFTGQRSQRNLSLYQRLGYREYRRDYVHDRLTLVFLEKMQPQ